MMLEPSSLRHTKDNSGHETGEREGSERAQRSRLASSLMHKRSVTWLSQDHRMFLSAVISTLRMMSIRPEMTFDSPNPSCLGRAGCPSGHQKGSVKRQQHLGVQSRFRGSSWTPLPSPPRPSEPLHLSFQGVTREGTPPTGMVKCSQDSRQLRGNAAGARSGLSCGRARKQEVGDVDSRRELPPLPHGLPSPERSFWRRRLHR